MYRIAALMLLVVFSLFYVSAEISLDTLQITTIVSDDAKESVNFFNGENDATFTAKLLKNSPVLKVEYSSISVSAESYGSFSLVIGGGSAAPGVYFDNLLISKDGRDLFNVPIIAVVEDGSFNLNHDVSIGLQSYDIDTISGEMILSPRLEVYKLDYDNPRNSAVLQLSAYTLDGDLIYSSEEAIAVSRAADFERFINLGDNPSEEVILVASTESNGRIGFDIAQLNTVTWEILLSPAVEKKDYSFWIYLIVFVLLLGTMIGLSYYWNHRVMNQAKDWKSRVTYIKKTQFSDSARALRKLVLQRDVLVRAYGGHYIAKESYQKGIAEIDRLMTRLKKRL